MFRAFKFTALLCAASCAEAEPESMAPVVCESSAPVRLLDVSLEGVADWSIHTAHAGEQIVARFSALSDDSQDYISSTHLVDPCGTSSVELNPRSDERPAESIGAVGSWVLGRRDDESLRWIAPDGRVPTHVAFSSAGRCLVEIAGGLATVDAEGTLWFHPDPADRDVEATALAHDIVAPGGGGNGPDFACRPGSLDAPVVEGDELLVVEPQGPLVRIQIPSGKRVPVIDAHVDRFAMFDDPRYVLWLEGTDGTAECCRMRVRDRMDGQDIDIGFQGSIAFTRLRGTWVAAYVRDPPTKVIATTFVDAATGLRRTVEGQWELMAQLSPTLLLVQGPDREEVSHIVDTTNGSIVPIDFPVPSLWDPTYDDGVLGFESDGLGLRGRLVLLRRETLAIETLADLQSPYMRLQDGTIVFVERVHDDDPTGTLVVLRDGQRRELATDVRLPFIPYLGTERELDEVLYTRLTDDGAELWRYALR